MEAFHFLTYILAVVAGLIAGYAWWDSYGNHCYLKDLHKQVRTLEAEIKELKRSKR